MERLASGRVEEQSGVALPGLPEVEHVVQRAGDRVEGAADPRQLPVVLDEFQDGTLVGQGAGDEVAPGPRRDDQQRQPGPVAASAAAPGQRRHCGRVAAEPGAGEEVLRSGEMLPWLMAPTSAVKSLRSYW